MSKLIPLINKIESIRSAMISTAEEKGVTHPQTLKYSRELDKLIIQYYQCSTK
ncbi:hypothetical protein J2S74_004103 [Evansella vedderi]|uniref:Spo0E like sporulation regulatory protein n=1 Tax=Evansella vedderi TaxID=38282 RepID=A0ABT9ZZK6_9BACI|nr:aspartyl-phosphate phosphatase Spo0E family protein [Evansella vedderi]MDQ0256681.1 hypothetical protein [Evansella vedderi]